jgi:hypothetical protein
MPARERPRQGVVGVKSSGEGAGAAEIVIASAQVGSADICPPSSSVSVTIWTGPQVNTPGVTE